MLIFCFDPLLVFIIALSFVLFYFILDRLLPLPKDYISDNFNLAQLPPIVERIGFQAMGDDAIPVAKALQQHRIDTAAAAAAAAVSSSGTTTSPAQPEKFKSTSYPIYRRALRHILNEGIEGDDDDDEDEEDLIIPPYAIQKAAEALYLMVHARFVISPRGLEAIRHVMVLDNTVFGKCPRSTCKGTGLLPYGYSNDYTSDATINIATSTTKSKRKEHGDSCCHRYCPSCGEVWISWDSKTDGCAWGPSWCHLFLLAFGSQVYAKELAAAADARRITSSYDYDYDYDASSTAAPPPSPPVLSRSFLPRSSSSSTRSSAVANTNKSSDHHNSNSSNFSSRPTPSVFGFRIHPATSFGRPLNEQPSLRGGGGSNEYEYNN